MKRQSIIIPHKEIDLIQGWLDSGEPIPDAGPMETVKRYTADFGEGIEIDIKVCNCEDEAPYIDAVMFEDGFEVMCLDVGYKLLREYIFEAYHDIYVVDLKSC